MIAHATSSCLLPPSCRRPGRCRQAVVRVEFGLLASVLLTLAPLRRSKLLARGFYVDSHCECLVDRSTSRDSHSGARSSTDWTWFLINFNTHKKLEVVRPRQESRPSLCTVLTKSTPRAKYTFTDGRRHRCRPPALRRPAVRGDGRPRRRGASGVVTQRYSSFMTSTLTFRHLKQHLSDTLGLPYGMFSLPDGRYADTLDDEVDAIAVRCDGGARDVECVSRPGYVPREPRLRVHHVAGYGVLVLLAVALFRKRPRRRSVDKDK